MPITPTTDPTDWSMLRLTITRTIPVASTAMPAACTENVMKLTGCRMFGLAMPRPIQMKTRARTIPNWRRSISVALTASPILARVPRADTPGAVPATGVTAFLLARQLLTPKAVGNEDGDLPRGAEQVAE